MGIAVLSAIACLAASSTAAPAKKPKKKAPTAAAPVATTPAVTTIEIGTPVAPPPPPVVPASAAPDQPIVPRVAVAKRFSIELNPLPVIAGRYGANVEYALARHHVVTASAFYQAFTPATLKVIMPSEVNTSGGANGRLGGELGYRFYTGTRGANGFFAGASAVAMPLALPRLKSDANGFSTDVVSFETFGGALDVGAQAIFDSGLTIGGGLGVMFLAYQPPSSVTPPPGAPDVHAFEPHVLPRLLFAAGWSF